MKISKNYILTISSDLTRLKAIQDLLKNNFKTIITYKKKSFEEAIDFFLDNEKIDFVIIDTATSGYDGFKLLKKLKSISSRVGALILSESITKKESLQALRFGAQNILSLDKSKEKIIVSLKNYFDWIGSYKLNEELIQFLKEKTICYQIPNSLKYVQVVSHHLTRDLAQVGLVTEEQISDINFALQEIIINAIEHGNLGISFEEKSRLLQKGLDLFSIIEKYSSKKEYSDKKVSITFKLSNKKAIYTITDEGKGFDHKSLPDIKTSNDFLLEHGRGIIMAKKYFDEFYYNKKGNEVTMIIHKNNL